MPTTVESGRQGEQLAVVFLQNKGYQVVFRNFRAGRAEIDLIVQKDNLLVFVEVKARTNKTFGTPETFVNYAKSRRIVKAAEDYIYRKNWQGEIRFDIVAITHRPELEIVHLPDAFF